MPNRITELFDIRYPVVQGGMIWCAGWELASAVSNAGGLGVIGSGSMYPEVLRVHIKKCKQATPHPFAVNVPLLYPNIEEHMQTIVDEKVPVAFTSAGNPKAWTSFLKAHGVKVVHVVSSVKFALKAEQAGVDALVAEGFEAGGHNGREETTTLCLIPMIADAVKVPLLAAGGIGTGRAMAAVMSLGADGVQIGSRFVASEESSAHLHFKNKVVATREGDTALTLKELAPVRLIKNAFYDQLTAAYKKGTDTEELKNILGRSRAKKGMFQGDLTEGELEIGQVSGQISAIKPARQILCDIIAGYEEVMEEIRQQAHSRFCF